MSGRCIVVLSIISLSSDRMSHLLTNFQAANLLKRTEGLVTLVVANPGKRSATPAPPDSEKNSISKPTLRPSAPPSRPSTPTPGNCKQLNVMILIVIMIISAEPISDPATCSVAPGKETTIEIHTDNKSLGLYFVGGKDTLIAVSSIHLFKFVLRKDGFRNKDTYLCL